MAYTLGSKCAKNLCKRIVILQLIIKNVVTCFLKHSAYTTQIKLLESVRFTAPRSDLDLSPFYVKKCSWAIDASLWNVLIFT